MVRAFLDSFVGICGITLYHPKMLLENFRAEAINFSNLCMRFVGVRRDLGLSLFSMSNIHNSVIVEGFLIRTGKRFYDCMGMVAKTMLWAKARGEGGGPK